MARLLDDGIQGRQELIDEFRTELRLLAKTFAAVSQMPKEGGKGSSRPPYLARSSDDGKEG